MTIVYETDRVVLHHAKAEDVLPQFVTESFDLVLTDPPYGVSHSSGWREESFGVIENDALSDRELIRDIVEQCVRLVGQKRHLYVFGPSDVVEGMKVSETAELVWDRGVVGQGNLSSAWGPQHEAITFAVSFHRHAGNSGKSSPAVRMRKGSVLRHMRPTGRKTLHPNQKPTSLLRELIESSTRQGDVVLDPFAGISSTGVAAIQTNRRAVLVEMDERWIEPSIDRLKSAEDIADQMFSL